ncbi:MAG: hypothetical protein JSU07_10105 [Bacteroidetes bacterium]|nr:hypothetical protein [Bacteroidota bacterium]
MRLIFFTSLIFLFSCGDDSAIEQTPSQPTDFTAQTNFDLSITKELRSYEDLVKFLETKYDILKTQDLHKGFVLTKAPWQCDSVFTQFQNCYGASKMNEEFEFSNFPDSLRPQIVSILNKIDSSKIVSFLICEPKKISITFKRTEIPNDKIIQHMLMWNTPKGKDCRYEFNKDSLIAPNLIYRMAQIVDAQKIWDRDNNKKNCPTCQ